MPSERKRIGDVLVEAKIITPQQLEEALKIQKQTNKKLGEILVEKGYITEDELIEILEFQLGIPHIKLDVYPIDPKAVEMISESIARRHTVLPVSFDEDGNLIVAMADPLNIFAMEDIEIYSGRRVRPRIAKASDIKRAIERFYGKQEALKAAEELQKESSEKDSQAKRATITPRFQLGLEDGTEGPIVRLVNSIFEQAITSRASDIHIEPFENEIKVRYRIDGVLYDVLKLDIGILSSLVARIKIIGNMDIAEKRIPQDGRTTYIFSDKIYDMRISSLPCVYGEKIVVRVIDKSAFVRSKAELGLTEEDEEKFNKLIAAPHGIILVCGPTGSGKSTTLYTILNELNTGTRNIITVEDPVESTIEGINQVEVNTKAGLTFAAALRSILRQDPDIIMIGEIRDRETADMAIRAAITGHLVLSTIHTNDAASAITRLVDMGIENFLISSSLVGVISQRLVRKLCSYCKEPYEPSEEEKILLDIKQDENVKLYRKRGCHICDRKGYYGRTGVYEILIVTKELRKLINKKDVSSEEIKELAVKQGMKTLRQACRERVLNGITSVEEYLKITYALE
ncbi:type IV pilus assembly protein PilB [Caldicellulosiruptor bescii]|uniref:Type II secretion system protein E n=2 Tax=Caldicellulosiruptor bescii TaxID=31899 RepID=B9MKW4_CALBD|nr:ATPase, T2SS/T4P/T4SS family [Caldicellulosiruptor bescii]ACM60972.1 type II secretion system protein E [Caldicellulosiruptor bescii DSM 6725]PBC89213.1 type IV pilus assembly protein PilB [Caldicellulosiruptor bescii]PBC91305.1 type IV pilus assembly protein PilB [Caldicellulosiruptor bescii]PBD03283.1 type IV pilus assembly protein PilB [Caldicellulosiruptor bescii]PBD07103.1 type IV pilus assembly protein PilB [Caldicellulosiruptor bescii]